jgi:uncharacterized membrane-anchored protein
VVRGGGQGMRNQWYAVAISFALVAGVAPTALAQDTPADVLRKLNYRTGLIAVGDQLATIDVNQSFRYLDASDTQTFLTKVWGNPPGAGKDSLGMLLPTSKSPLTTEGFAIIIDYDPIGYVSDDDAEKIDYAELLRDMQDQTREASKRRVENGYESIELLGWARQPYYDKASKKLYWAKRLRFGAATDETLNYNIRILGRRGVLNLNVVAAMEALPWIDRQNGDILSMVSFNQGNLYSEFNPGLDKAAAFGIAGLIAGGVLTKTGFFKGLLVLLLASKKLGAVAIFGGLAALWGGLKAMFRRRRAA